MFTQLFAHFEQKLHADADAQQWRAGSGTTCIVDPLATSPRWRNPAMPSPKAPTPWQDDFFCLQGSLRVFRQA
jgi:hypothetical protein